MHASGPEATDILQTISKATEQDSAIAFIISAFCLLALLHHFLRRLYPCITISELNGVETLMDDDYDWAVKNEYLRGYELDYFKQTRLRVKKRASEIRTQGLQTPASFLKKCLDVDVELMSAIATWNAEVEGLQRDIAVVVENEKRCRYNIELGRRAMLATNV